MESKDSILGFRCVSWSDHLKLLDQRILPHETKFVECYTAKDVYEAIKNMTVRGAPAIGVAGAYGMVLGFMEVKESLKTKSDVLKVLKETKEYLDKSRPTAVNLMWGTERIYNILKKNTEIEENDIEGYFQLILKEALNITEEDVAINSAISENGYSLFQDIEHPISVIHHCNTGALATVDIGTALGVIYGIHNHGKQLHVYVDETRPRLQGAKLTAYELKQAGIPFHLMVDGASGLLMRTHKIDAVLFGADRVAANGDVANKIGTYNLAVVAHENHVPVYACVPVSTIDPHLSDGSQICIEERSGKEVTEINNTLISPADIEVYNPAFDITPHEYITAIITEKGVLYPPFDVSIRKLFD